MVAAHELTLKGEKGDKKRQHVRIQTNLPVHYSSEEDRTTHLCRTANISKGGVFIQTPEILKPETKLNILIPIFDKFNRFGKQRIIVKGQVVHFHRQSKFDDDLPGLGVEFAGLGQYNWHQVLKTISQYLRHKDNPDIQQMIEDAELQYEDLAEKVSGLPAPDFDDEEDDDDIDLEWDDEVFESEPVKQEEAYVKRQKRIPKLFRGRFLTPQGEINAFITNLSHGGVGFVSPETIPVGSELALSMGSTVLDNAYVKGQIVHRKALTSGMNSKYSYGMAFFERNPRFSILVDSLEKQTQAELSVPIHLGISLK